MAGGGSRIGIRWSRVSIRAEVWKVEDASGPLSPVLRGEG